MRLLVSIAQCRTLPRAVESDAHTAGISAGSTNADVDAPTILTLDSPATAPHDRASHTAPQVVGSPAKPAASAAGFAAAPPSIITVPQQQRPKVEVPLAHASGPAVSAGEVRNWWKSRAGSGGCGFGRTPGARCRWVLRG